MAPPQLLTNAKYIADGKVYEDLKVWDKSKATVERLDRCVR